ncbi:TPA: TrkA family potassium uptake protein [Candidatus Galligastranaerophilus intestinavium]|uniref:TrkA family potassium uptake protein n=1 Tax=Candidatus Galligastranaerophilus intestinavium TaxID=2840836 RepID=A0A9D1JY73_9BACT|nr:TrkA family potassium uptake protein [Candidatus Galligastranaerophilus intestinavium]HIT54687.1 TrkA family potassium uptake protein [Candidatus Galligastranaerophilus intestinigallinarum]
MSTQVLIIGLGQFGMSLARTLSEKGAEVIAADSDKELVEEAASFLDDAICLDATDETAMARLCPKERDVVICAIGAREPSILTTAILKQMGCENIIARATDKIHERILKAVGAKNVINPDAEYGKKFAYKILFQNIINDETSENIQLLEINVQPFMEGKNLIELALPNKYGIIVAAIKKGNKLTRPFPNEILDTKDKLLLVCTEDAIAKMIEENK